MCLFDGIDCVSLCLQVVDSIQGMFVINPFDTLFRPQSSLMDLRIGRATTDTAKHDFFYPHSVSSAEHRAHIILTADIIEHHY